MALVKQTIPGETNYSKKCSYQARQDIHNLVVKYRASVFADPFPTIDAIDNARLPFVLSVELALVLLQLTHHCPVYAPFPISVTSVVANSPNDQGCPNGDARQGHV
jgi:hypothetical protein